MHDPERQVRLLLSSLEVALPSRRSDPLDEFAPRAAMTPIQKRAYEVYARRRREGLEPPTMAELARELGLTNRMTAWEHANALVKKRWLIRAGAGRTDRRIRLPAQSRVERELVVQIIQERAGLAEGAAAAALRELEAEVQNMPEAP